MRMLALCVDKHAMEDGRYASLGGKAFGKAGSTFAMAAVALQQLGPEHRAVIAQYPMP